MKNIEAVDDHPQKSQGRAEAPPAVQAFWDLKRNSSGVTVKNISDMLN